MEIGITDRWYRLIASGQKVIEGRKGSPTYSRLKVGNYVIFLNESTGERLVKSIAAVNKYPDVRTMLLTEGLDRVLPGVSSIEEGVAIYMSFWNEADVQRMGVLALCLL